MKKMEGEKPHRSSSGSSELFICFTSRPSSSSMKISSKSILSLGRTEKFRDGSSSSSTLHTSLSRRLRHNGSMKGGQSSPMFPTTGKKKGCSFETPEPTSPKVTCIGQVRVKTKKQGKKMRARSKRRGEGSFRKSQEGLEKAGEEEKLGRRSQRWVSLPLSICEALRALGAEFNCFMPCGGRSSCWSSGVERGKAGEKRSTSCGAVFARWLMAVDEGEEEKRREIEEPIVLVVENRRENLEEELEEKEAEAKETKVEEEDEEDDDESSGICIPPKNALLLMRCRSEPLRMASYMNRFWESPAPEEDEEEDVDDDDDDDDNDEREEEEEPEEGAKKDVNNEGNESVVSKEELEQMQEEETTIPSKSVASADATEESENTAEKQATVEVEVEVDVEESNEPREEQEGNEFSDEMVVDISSSVEKAPEEPQNSTDEEKEDNTQTQSLKSEVEVDNDECRETHLQKIEEKAEKEEEETYLQKTDDLKEEETETLIEQPEVKEEEDDESRVSSSSSAMIQSEEDPLKEEGESTEDQTRETVKEEKSTTTAEILVEEEEEEENERETEKRNEEIRDKSLPECLLLMLCEPKLSMEVSKETWVCSTDFLRWRPEKQTATAQTQICADDGDNDPTDSHLPHPPPATSNPAPTSDNHAQPPVSDLPEQQASPAMGAVVEQKMASAATYEPFALTRCKSEPVRSSDKLAPEACFWKSRKLEQHPLGIGAAGIGF